MSTRQTLRKSYEIARFKALDETGTEGRFEAVVAVFDNVDRVGDRVVPGAFTKSIEGWRSSGDPIPVIWSHDWGNPYAHIGYVDPSDVAETRKGLRVTGVIDLSNPFGAQVFNLMKSRRVKEFSFAYDVLKERPGKDRANELLELDLIELGPTLKGVNDDTELLGVKASLEEAASATSASGAVNLTVEMKAGRTISKANEGKIRAAIQSLQEVLSALGEASEQDDPPAKSDEVSDEPADEVLGFKAQMDDLLTRRTET